MSEAGSKPERGPADGAARGQRRRRKRQPLKASPEALERAALRYLDRYDAASGHLRRLLMGKVTLSARVHGTDASAGAAAVDRLIQRLAAAGVLNDARFARERLRSLRAKGCSLAMVRARLAAKGLAQDLIETTLAEADEDAVGTDLAAALTYARRRRLGPFRSEARAERRDRDLAALGRQGFDYETARRVIDCDDPAALAADADSG
ncbi:regulatory protein RecX [Pelagibius sp.]|uniref:regulatory protein RecX n=1 Tax=Pelagibius sp. TaxID=1931238 RepID=UPI003B508FE8